MKKILISLPLVLLFISLVFATSCDKDSINREDISTTATENTSVLNDDLKETVDKSEFETSDIGGGILLVQKYRRNYYDVPRFFSNLVEYEAFDEWYSVASEENPNITNQMVMKRFVQKFNISREDFDRANLEWARFIRDGFERKPVINPLDYANQEGCEVYDADIIYTFDDEIINEYYLTPDYVFTYEGEFEKAVESGEYVPQTPIWVDVEQMEADFIAKYGEESLTKAYAQNTETTTEQIQVEE